MSENSSNPNIYTRHVKFYLVRDLFIILGTLWFTLNFSHLDLWWMIREITHIDIKKIWISSLRQAPSCQLVKGGLYKHTSKANDLSHQNQSHGMVKELPSLPWIFQHCSDVHSPTCLTRVIRVRHIYAFVSSYLTRLFYPAYKQTNTNLIHLNHFIFTRWKVPVKIPMPTTDHLQRSQEKV